MTDFVVRTFAIALIPWALSLAWRLIPGEGNRIGPGPPRAL